MNYYNYVLNHFCAFLVGDCCFFATAFASRFFAGAAFGAAFAFAAAGAFLGAGFSKVCSTVFDFRSSVAFFFIWVAGAAFFAGEAAFFVTLASSFDTELFSLAGGFGAAFFGAFTNS